MICHSIQALGAGAGAWGRGQGRPLPSHLVQDHLPVLRVSRGQEHLLALFVDLFDAWSQVWRGHQGEQGPTRGPCLLTQVRPSVVQLTPVSELWGGVNSKFLGGCRGGGSPSRTGFVLTLPTLWIASSPSSPVAWGPNYNVQVTHTRCDQTACLLGSLSAWLSWGQLGRGLHPLQSL